MPHVVPHSGSARRRVPDALALVGCQRDDQHLAKASIGIEGGTLAYRADGLAVVVEVPSGALAEATELTIDPHRQRAVGAIGPMYDLGPSGLTFRKPVKVTLVHRADDLRLVRPARLALATRSSGSWQILPVAEAEPKGTAGWTTHFSPFATVLAEPNEDLELLGEHTGRTFSVPGFTLAELA